MDHHQSGHTHPPAPLIVKGFERLADAGAAPSPHRGLWPLLGPTQQPDHGLKERCHPGQRNDVERLDTGSPDRLLIRGLALCLSREGYRAMLVHLASCNAATDLVFRAK
jgi:hypothetical protein